jgi:hypothetical protein
MRSALHMPRKMRIVRVLCDQVTVLINVSAAVMGYLARTSKDCCVTRRIS